MSLKTVLEELIDGYRVEYKSPCISHNDPVDVQIYAPGGKCCTRITGRNTIEWYKECAHKAVQQDREWRATNL